MIDAAACDISVQQALVSDGNVGLRYALAEWLVAADRHRGRR